MQYIIVLRITAYYVDNKHDFEALHIIEACNYFSNNNNYESKHNLYFKLKQEALDRARKMWVDYLFFVDADNIILHKELFTTLIKRNKLVVGPMLETGVAWSNYWSDQVKTKIGKRL